MKLRPVFIAAAFVLPQMQTSSVLADVREPTTVSALEIMVTTVGTLLVPLNTVLWTREGSVTAGAGGIFMGATQVVVGVEMEDDLDSFKAFNIVVGALGVIAGAGSMLRGMHTQDQAQNRLEIAPVVDVSDHSVGVQLIARW